MLEMEMIIHRYDPFFFFDPVFVAMLSWPEASCVTSLCYVHELIAKRVIVTIGYSS